MIHDMDTIHSQMLAARLKAAKEIDPSKSREKALMEACEGFEAIFTKTLIDTMRDSLPGDALFEKSNGRRIFESMHDEQLAEEMAKAPTASGLKEFLFNQLKESL